MDVRASGGAAAAREHVTPPPIAHQDRLSPIVLPHPIAATSSATPISVPPRFATSISSSPISAPPFITPLIPPLLIPPPVGRAGAGGLNAVGGASMSTAQGPVLATALKTGEGQLVSAEQESESAEELEQRSSALSQPLPAWLVSLIVHVTLILSLALIPLVHELGQPFVISVSNGQDEVTQEFEISAIDNSPGEVANLGLAPAEPIVSESAVSLLETLIGDSMSTESQLAVATPKIESSLSGRSGDLKSTLLAAYGGTEGTEQAVADGLAWLARQQRSDGAWSLRGPYTNGGFSENKPAATAMALIAFAGAGYHHQDGQYKTNVAKGLKYLLSQQDSDGCFAAETPDRQMMYAHGQATIAVCELYGMTKDVTLRNPAQRALDFAEAAQSPQGGWRYIPREDSDTSVTGWYVMALMSAKMAGLSTSKKTLDNVSRFLDTVRHDGGAQYGYVISSNPFPSMSAEGLLCRQYLGWDRNRDALVRGCEKLANEPISTDAENRSYYYWYYATQALHHFGGQPWKKWNDVMVVELPKLQVKDSKERGSWPPQHDPYGSAGGRIYSTCFAIYCLEVYYRHLPLYSLNK